MPSPQRSLHPIFVIGNESADLDSICSALSVSFLGSIMGFPGLVPVADVRFRASLKHRKDLVTLLELLDLSHLLNTFTILSDVPSDASAVLVDHNVPKVSTLNIVGILDHHHGKLPSRLRFPSEIRTTSASTCALVAELFKKHDYELRRMMDSKTLLLYMQMLHAVILIDSDNFDENKKKYEPRDLSIVEWIESRPGFKALHKNRAQLTKLLNDKRTDLTGLSIRDILYLDTKFNRTLGFVMVTVPEKLSVFEVRPKLKDEMDSFLAEEKVELLICLCAKERIGDTKKRGLLIHTKNEAKSQEIVQTYFKNTPTSFSTDLKENQLFKRLGFTDHGFGMASHRNTRRSRDSVYVQGRTSRKILMPAVIEALSKMKTDK